MFTPEDGPMCPCCKNIDHDLIEYVENSGSAYSAFVIRAYGSVSLYACIKCGCIFVRVKDNKIIR